MEVYYLTDVRISGITYDDTNIGNWNRGLSQNRELEARIGPDFNGPTASFQIANSMVRKLIAKWRMTWNRLN